MHEFDIFTKMFAYS